MTKTNSPYTPPSAGVAFTEKELAHMFEQAKRDDWHRIFVGSEIRVLISMAQKYLEVVGARSESTESTWVQASDRLPAMDQEVRFVPASGAVFNGWFGTNAFGSDTFFRGDGYSKIVHGSYTPKVVLLWMPLPTAPILDKKGD